ncbi:MAG: family 1 glycosylhydrolase, partial [Acidimicrobiales bacterium]
MREPLFGLSAAGFRLEGGFNGPGEPSNQWGPLERAGMAPRGAAWSAAVQGAGVWAGPDRVLEVASAAGAGVLALSVEWARIEPAPGRIDEAAADRYASIFASAAARGITPVGVLCDISTPGWLGEEFWLTPGSPDRFAEHAGRLVARIGASCRHWVTLRQPNLVALKGWVEGRHPPRRVGAMADAWAVVDNLLAAHVLAYGAIHDAQPRAEVVFGLRASPSYDWHGLLADLLCAPALGVEREEVDGWIDARRTRHDAMVPPRDLGELAWRRLAAATSPFGVAGTGLRTLLRRPSPRRALDLVYHLASDRPRAATGAGSGAGTGAGAGSAAGSN